MRKAFFIPLLLAGVVFLLADTVPIPASKKKAAAKPAATTSKKPAPKTAAAKKKSTSTKKTVVARKPIQSWRTSQRVPTPDRYKEIQQALATKGYLPPDSPSGVWDTSSVAALKKFQVDQSLEPSGKIDSLSLIALGLGPRRDSAPAPQQSPQQAPQQSPQ